jgi:hypothetical protein
VSRDASVFPGMCDETGAIHLDNAKQQRAYCRAKFAGQPVDVIIAPIGARKTRLQQAGFHAMVTPWAREEGHRIDDLKRDLLRHVFGEIDHTNPITGEITKVLVEPHTSSLSRAKYSELIERTLEIAAECGVYLEAPSEYRERKERERKIALRKAS